MQQYYEGFPVFGGYAIVHSAQPVAQIWGSNPPASMTGVLYEELKADLGQPSKAFIEHAKEGLQQFKARFPQQDISEETVTPWVYVDANQRAHWAYKVSILISYEDKVPERPTALIDADTYQPFVQWNDIKMVTKVSGRGFGGNTHSGQFEYGKGLPKLELTRDDTSNMCFMENNHTKVVDMLHRESGRNSAMHFICGDAAKQSDGAFFTGYRNNGYDKINGAFSPSNDALYAGGIIYDMYRNWYGLYPIEYNGKPKKLIMRVHFGRNYDNAFWDGQQMTFGDGSYEFYPMVSLGIGAHEISHGFTESHANLMYFGESGGMNESFSDMAAKAAEFYAYGKNDWMIGSEIVKESSGVLAFRFMDHPRRDGRSIDHASQYMPGMDVHHTSGVYNRLFYLLATQAGWDVRKAFQVMVSANADYWTPTTTFDEGACGILSAANSFNYALDDVKQALDQVGVDYSNCGENV